MSQAMELRDAVRNHAAQRAGQSQHDALAMPQPDHRVLDLAHDRAHGGRALAEQVANTAIDTAQHFRGARVRAREAGH